jgi:hypothetical protein
MARSRSVREQVKSGLRIAGSMVLAFIVFTGLWISFAFILQNTGGSRPARAVLGVTLVLLLETFLFLTVRHWAKWLLGLFAYSSFRLFGGVIFGPYLTHSLDRRSAVVWFLYALAAYALTVRYLRRRPKRLESVGLVLFVSCIALAASIGSAGPVFAGLAGLGACEVAQRAIPPRARVATPRPTH